MARAKRGFKLRRRHKKILKLARGYRGARSKLYRPALQFVRRGLLYAYRDRRNKKRVFRALWIQRINAAARACGITYSVLLAKLKSSQVSLDRRALAELAISDFPAFSRIVESVTRSS